MCCGLTAGPGQSRIGDSVQWPPPQECAGLVTGGTFISSTDQMDNLNPTGDSVMAWEEGIGQWAVSDSSKCGVSHEPSP